MCASNIEQFALNIVNCLPLPPHPMECQVYFCHIHMLNASNYESLQKKELFTVMK